ncbi:MAG: glycosyltransferase family 4 protein [Nannocystales bacterium]
MAPPLEGPITGGTLYNRFLCEALTRCGDRVEVVAAAADCEGFAWVDSLFLPHVAELWSRRPMGLLAHYLPSVFEGRTELESFERLALRHAALVVCTGAWMLDTVAELGVPMQRLALVEPGVSAAASVADPVDGVMTALLVGTVTQRKGVLELIEEVRRSPPTEPWRLEVLGDQAAEPEYAQACKDAAVGLPVAFLGARPPEEALDVIGRADVLVSAATVESYGMAIAEAQACGVPVLARRGGHVAQLVSRVPSGVVVDGVPALVTELRRHAQAPAYLADLREISRAHRPKRTWDDAASEFRTLR